MRHGLRVVRPDLFTFALVQAPSTRVTRWDLVRSSLATWGGGAAFALGVWMMFLLLGELPNAYLPQLEVRVPVAPW